MLFSLEPQVLVILIFCLIFALTFHEFAHAAVATLFGDPTSKMAGRLSLNPLVHLDIWGSAMLLLAGFGYAKPVPVNSQNFRYQYADTLVAVAGPAMNLLLAILGGILLNLALTGGWLNINGFPLDMLLTWFMFINMNLCLFNLLPFTPLDGSYVWPVFLPQSLRRKYEIWNLQYGIYILMTMLLISFVLPAWSPFRWIASGSRELIRWMI